LFRQKTWPASLLYSDSLSCTVIHTCVHFCTPISKLSCCVHMGKRSKEKAGTRGAERGRGEGERGRPLEP